MIIKSIRVQNFRSILDETLHCEQLTALVGPNGSGKSSFLRALELFYSTSAKYDSQDFHAGDSAQDVEITVTFTDLEPEEKERFEIYLEGEALTVTRVLSLVDDKMSAKYYGSRLQSPDFAPIREAGKAAEKKTAYEEVQKNQKYIDLPKWTKQDDATAALKNWESEHADQCTRQRDDGQFFGFTEVAQGYLGQHTRFILIPAVRDAAEDAADSRGSPITEIMNLVVRSVLANREEVRQLKEDTQRQYDEIMEPSRLAELSALEGQLTATLKSYVPDAGIKLSWIKADNIDIPMPRADVKLDEDGYSSAVARTGHGLQRAFILTMLQHLTVAQNPREPRADTDSADVTALAVKPDAAKPKLPNLILGIEEPELYQHPNRQRHFAKILLQLTSGTVPGVAQKTQLVYTTHSPLFVGIDRFDQVRRLRKVTRAVGKPKVTRIARTTLDEVAEVVWEANSRKDRKGNLCEKFTGSTLKPRLQTLMTPWISEGFFADVAVLVEGEDDRAAIIGMALSMDPACDLESMGISVIPCIGKDNLDRPAAIFRQLGIPIYVVWDSDSNGNKDQAVTIKNHRLLSLMQATVEDYPETVADTYACFKTNLETVLSSEIGEDLFADLLSKAQQDFSYDEKQAAMKSPLVLQRVLLEAQKQGHSSKTLQGIVSKILELKK